jgi:hypothetical protein
VLAKVNYASSLQKSTEIGRYKKGCLSFNTNGASSGIGEFFGSTRIAPRALNKASAKLQTDVALVRRTLVMSATGSLTVRATGYS